jgi:hypothetical protein
MPSLLAVHAGRQPHDAAITELREGGVMTATKLDPLVNTLVAVITNPTLVVTVELDEFGRDYMSELATIWRNDDTAVIGGKDSRGQFQLLQIEPHLLPFHLAQAVRMVPRPQPAFSGSFTVPAGTLNAVEAMITTDPSRAERELAAAGVATVWVDRFLATLIMRRSMWAVESIWLGDRRRRVEARLSVLDGGFAGYWRLSHNNGRVTVTPNNFDDLMRLLAALLPGYHKQE